MKLHPPEAGHLTWCTNALPCESWPETFKALRDALPELRRRLGLEEPMGVGLRLSAQAAEELIEPRAMEEFRAFLDDAACYVFSINAFPYGRFHRARVKEQVYQPDWSTPERLTYTNRCAEILSLLLPEGQTGSISTVPGTFRPLAADPTRRALIRRNLVKHAAYLVDLHRRGGKLVKLAIEPEPCCMLETVSETPAWFEEELLSAQSISELAVETGIADGHAERALRDHIGVCYDVCHAAVEFEDAADSIAALKRAGIEIPKLQLSSALRVGKVDRDALRLLEPFAEPVYLHQVVAARENGLRRYLDLPEAVADGQANLGAEWRIHYHVPVSEAEFCNLGTTQDFLQEVLAIHRASPVSAHLEVETYTWPIMPGETPPDLMAGIAKELEWVLAALNR